MDPAKTKTDNVAKAHGILEKCPESPRWGIVGQDIPEKESMESKGGEDTTSSSARKKKVSFVDVVKGNIDIVRGKVVSTK